MIRHMIEKEVIERAGNDSTVIIIKSWGHANFFFFGSCWVGISFFGFCAN